MKTRHAAVAVFVMAALTAVFPRAVSALPAQDVAAGPELAVSFESGRQDIATQGWPLVVVVQLTLAESDQPEAATQPLILASTGTAWTDALRVTVTDELGKAVVWPLHLGTLAAPTVTLDAASSAVAGWWLSPEETAALETGRYDVTIMLDTTGVPVEGAWQGLARGQAQLLTVAAEPAPLAPELAESRALLLAGWHTLCGRTAEALAALDDLLSRQPESIDAQNFKANLQDPQGPPRRRTGCTTKH